MGGKTRYQNHVSAATGGGNSTSLTYSHFQDLSLQHLPHSHHCRHSSGAACLGTLVSDVVISKVKPLRRATFQSLRHDLRQLPHAPVAEDLPTGRRSKLMFSMMENLGWVMGTVANPTYRCAKHWSHVETICIISCYSHVLLANTNGNTLDGPSFLMEHLAPRL